MAEDTEALSRSTSIIAICTAISRFTGALLVVVLAGILGRTTLSDSYNLANVMPNMLYDLMLGGILTSLFIPIFVDYHVKSGTESSIAASNILNISLLVLAVIGLMGTAYSYYFVRLQTFLVPGKSEGVALAGFFFKFFIWEIVFYGACTVLNGVLQTYRRFFWPAAAPIFNNLVTIATLYIYAPLRLSNPGLAVVILAVGTTLGVASMAAIQVPALFRTGFKWHPVLNLRHPAVKKLALLSVPILAYVASNQVGLTVANALAYQFPGGFTAFTYSWRFFQFPYGLFAVSIATVLFPRIAEQAATKDMDGFKKSLSLGIRTTGFIMLPISVLIFLAARPMVTVLLTGLMRGLFTVGDSYATASVLAYFALGLFPFSIFIFLTRLFYALKDTMTPMKVNALGVPLNIALDVLLVRRFGVAGLAMGHTLTYLFTMSILLLALRRRIGPLSGREMALSTVKFSLASILMGLIIALAVTSVGGLKLASVASNLTQLAASLVAGGLFYFAVNYWLGTEELGFVLGMVRHLLRLEGRWQS